MIESTAANENKPTESKPRRGRKRNGAGQSRARVLNTARHLFAKMGFEATSIRQIASELGIVTASLYHHFLTKEEMLHEVLRAPLSRLADGVTRIANEPGDAERRLIKLVVLRIEAWLDDRDAHAISLNDAQFLMARDDFAYVEDLKRQGYLAMEKVLREGVEQGRFRQDLDIYYAIVAIAAFLNSAARSLQEDEFHTVEPPTPLSVERLTALLIDFVLRLVRTSARVDDPIAREWTDDLHRPETAN